MSSLSLSVTEWNYLKSLARELARRSGKIDPGVDGWRGATTSQAVRYLIEQDQQRRRKDAEGNLLFDANPGQVRKLILSTGTTTVQEWNEVLDLSGSRPRKKGGRK